MDVKVGFVLTLVVGCYLGTSEATYSNEVKTFFKDFSSAYEIDDCILEAKEKMNEFSDKSDDQKYSIAMVNLYTQECSGSFDVAFYSKLNEEMRNGATGMWKTAGDLMDRAIYILGETFFEVVYRGCSHNVGHVGNEYMFKMITSTSTNPQIAASFASWNGCGTLFILHNVKGPHVSKYSASPSENEVLLKSTNRFDFIKQTSSDTEIKAEMKNLNIEGDIVKIIHLKMNTAVSCASVNAGITPTTLSLIRVIIFHFTMSVVIF